MNRKLFTPLVHCWRIPMIAAMALTIGAARPAAAQLYHYKGRDATYRNIQMELYLKSMPGAPFSATGNIFVGNYSFPVKGTFAGTALTATIVYPGQYSGTAIRPSLTGTLRGALGTGDIAVMTGYVQIGGAAYMLAFDLMPQNASPAPGPGPAPPAPPFASGTRNFGGAASFGYTRVLLNLRFLATGPYTYSVSGNVTVIALRPQSVTHILPVWGTYDTRAIPASLTVANAPSGNHPHFGCTITGPKVLTAQLTGIPSLGINNLYFTCRVP